jgi:hypothetical protein
MLAPDMLVPCTFQTLKLVPNMFAPDTLMLLKLGPNTTSVKSAHAMSTWLFTYSSIKEHFTSIVGLEENRSYNHQSLQLRNNGFWV